MIFSKKIHSFVKKINTRATSREIEFYHKKKLASKIYFSIFRELIFVLKESSISAKSAQLTYTFILAIVPFLSILFTFVHSLHGLENIFTTTLSPLIKKHFGSQIGIQISDYLQTIIKNIQVKELGVISFITFSTTVILLLIAIEDTFNNMLHMHNHRTLLQRFLKCWIIITISPFLLALTAVKSDQLFHLIRANTPLFIEGTLIKSLRFFLGLVFQGVYFVFLYYIMPSKRLNLKSAILGGIVASILLEMLQYINIFLAKSAFSADPSKIYGSVPLIAVLFFAWIRLGWIVTLVGAASSLAAERIFYHKKEEILKNFPASDMIKCVALYCSISKIYKDTSLPVSLKRVAVKTNISLKDVNKWALFLTKKGLLFASALDRQVCYCPSYFALQNESNCKEFLKNILFSNHTPHFKEYNDIEKYFALCLKGNEATQYNK